MIPVYIAGCFAMLHPAPGRHGVVICGPVGDEALNTYRPLLFLAERFAAAGTPALRLEYYGTGDSAGEDGEPDRVQAWLDSITAAVGWLRENCGVGPVTLLGVRFGAALAARAACDTDDVAALIAIDPIPSGRALMRQLALAARTNAEIWQVDPRIDDGTWIEAHGLRLDRAAHAALTELDVRTLPRRPAPDALVLHAVGSPSGPAVARHLQQLGAAVVCEPADGLLEMLRDPYENAVPHAAFARAVAWQRERTGPASDGPRITQKAPIGVAMLGVTCGDEMPIRFGHADSLFGILSLPAQPRPGAPCVLIASTGASPRYGNARGAVTIARLLATQGIASLRMDAGGMGDAAIRTGERGQPYSAEVDRDLRDGIDALSQHCAAPIVVLGMCSGAFHAFRVAQSEPRIRGLILVNLQKFVWHDGESLAVVQRTTFRTTRFYMHNMIEPVVWQRLLRGEVNVPGITRALAGRAWRRVLATADPVITLLHRSETAVGRTRRRARELQRRGVPILFVLSGNDPGLDELAEYFGAQGRQFRRMPNVSYHVLEGADHTLSAHWARSALQQLIIGFLEERCVTSSPPVVSEAARPVSALADPTYAAQLGVAHPLAIDTGNTPA